MFLECGAWLKHSFFSDLSEDHYEEFAIQAKLGLPHIPELCAEEEASLEFPGNALLQLKSESQAASDERLSRAVAVVTHTHRASMRTVQALSDHSKLHLLEASFFTRTWKKARVGMGEGVRRG